MVLHKHKQQNSKHDSKTLDAYEKTRFTDRLTLRIDPETKKLLKRFSRETGTSVCQIIHALLTAFFVGVGDKIQLDAQSPTINLKIERVVARPRRYSRGGVRRVEDVVKYEEVDEDGVRYVDFYDVEKGDWVMVSADEFGVNEHGHAVGCGCLLCRRVGR